MWITWKHQDTDISSPPSFEEKVEIFYHRALGWQLHIADLIANGGHVFGESRSVQKIPHSGFAVLQICLSYFETIGQYEQRNPGTKRSSGYFKEGVQSVLPELHVNHGNAVDDFLTRLYKGARCGLYHNSMTVPGVGLGQPVGEEPIAYNSKSRVLAISSERLPKALKTHLEEFRTKLLDSHNVGLRRNFERRFDKDNGITGPSNAAIQPAARSAAKPLRVPSARKKRPPRRD